MGDTDILIIGAGAAGFAAAIFAAEAARGTSIRIVLVEGARKPGAKILVSGGGRCNVTNESVSAADFWGGPSTIVRNVLKAFDEQKTIDWMRSMGVELKLEPTGKYFPVTDKARTVLDALLNRVRELGVALVPGTRIERIERDGERFHVYTKGGLFASCARLIVATGGRSLPKSGSDGAGIEWMRSLGHTIVETTPALAPLLLDAGSEPEGRLAELSGISVEARLTLLNSRGARVVELEGPVLFTHFGLSGPAPMNLSRHISRYRLEHPEETPRVVMSHPRFRGIDDADKWLLDKAASLGKRLAGSVVEELYPERLARLLTEGMGTLATMSKLDRRLLATRLAALPLPVIGDRGYTFAETTAGGVHLREINHHTMESRRVSRLHLCGENLDVDGRIGGFNFQWAWASGYLAGRGAVAGIRSSGV